MNTTRELAEELGIKPGSLAKDLKRNFDKYAEANGGSFEIGLDNPVPGPVKQLIFEKRGAKKKVPAKIEKGPEPKKELLQKTQQVKAKAQSLQKMQQFGNTGQFDIGAVVFSSKISIFLFVTILLATQAYILANLAEIHLEGVFWEWFFIPAFIFEAAGLAVAQRPIPEGLSIYKRETEERNRFAWVYLFAFIQIMTDLSYSKIIEEWGDLDVSEIVARMILSIAIPVAISAYSFLYLKSTTNERQRTR